MRKLILCLIIGLLSACCPCKHLTTNTRDSISIETRIHKIYIKDTLRFQIPPYSVRQIVRDTSSHLETTIAVSDAWINKDGSLGHSLENRRQELPIPFEKEIVYRDSVVYKDRTDTKIVEVERKLTWWQQTKMRGFWILLAIVIFVFRKNIVTMARRFI